jgi:hypothetical protein
VKKGSGHAYCLLSNHYHFMVEMRDADLAVGMHRPSGVYAQRFKGAYGMRALTRAVSGGEVHDARPDRIVEVVA